MPFIMPDARIHRVAQVVASASRSLSAPPERVLEFLRDYRARSSILTSHFSGVRVEEGGEVIAYHFSSGGRERDFRLRPEQSAGELVERDQLSSFIQTWTVTPTATGSTVTVEASWQGSGGIGGFFERLFAPLGLRRIYDEVLDKLAAAVQGSLAE
jgi:hypothetical protein